MDTAVALYVGNKASLPSVELKHAVYDGDLAAAHLVDHDVADLQVGFL